jgi:hypothetical protein
MSSEAVMRVCSERAKERAGPRHTILPLPPHYHVRGERAVLVRGRKRPITALDETIAYSSVSDGSSSADSSRPPRFRRPTLLELEDEGVSARHTSREGPAMPTTGGDRGGGFAPAHRRNLDAAHSNNQTLQRASVMPAAVIPRVAGHQCLPKRGRVGVDMHLRKATTLIPRSAITITNPHLTDTLRSITNL